MSACGVGKSGSGRWECELYTFLPLPTSMSIHYHGRQEQDDER
jgi:hypothetical protein